MTEERDNFTTSPVDDDEPRVPTSRPIAAPIFMDDDDDEEGGMTAEERSAMYELYAPSLQSLGEGEIVRGTILAITDNEVLVDVGFKSEGVI
ncbi:MAG: 30S ribosomal protein S1, partial [Candidatus Eisenbacteria bacterium]